MTELYEIPMPNKTNQAIFHHIHYTPEITYT